MKEVSYKILCKDHLNDYRNIRLNCLETYPSHFGPTYQEEQSKKTLKFDDAILGKQLDDFIYGAFMKEELIGICGFVREKRTKTKHRGEISQLYVPPPFQGKGIGTSLLTKSIRKAFNLTELEQIILGVVLDNFEASKLYSGLGFVEYGRLDRYFKTDTQYYTQVKMVLSKSNWKNKKS